MPVLPAPAPPGAPEAPVLVAEGEPLLLAKITASGSLSPTAATIQLAQEFVNGPKLADVEYRCPVHPDWAVRRVTMKCGESEIDTIVMPKQKAEETFEQAKEDGHTAVLADEVASDELRFQLANVPAGETVEVTTEVVAWPMLQGSRGKYIIPLINGPKYGGTEAQQSRIDPDDIDKRETQCFLDLDLDLEGADIDVGEIDDNLMVQREIEPHGQVTIMFDAEPHAMWHSDDSGNYLVVGVPSLDTTEEVDWGRTAVLIDRSGSMGGQGMTVASHIARRVGRLLGDKLVSAYWFDNDCQSFWPNRDIPFAAAVGHLDARGGTELQKALETVHQALNDKIDNLIVITDALYGEGYESHELARTVGLFTSNGIAVHVVLVGVSPGRYVGEVVSYAGGGFFMEQSGADFPEDEIDAAVDRFLRGGAMLEAVTIGDHEFKIGFPVRGRPVMCAINADEVLSAGKPAASDISIKMRGIDEPYGVHIVEAPETRFIWARERVMETIRSAWANGQSIHNHEKEITDLGVKHGILTPFTSMVGFDPSKVHDRSDTEQVIAQASLPVGMDAAAYRGGMTGSTGPAGSAGPMGATGATGARGMVYLGSAGGPTLNASFLAAPERGGGLSMGLDPAVRRVHLTGAGGQSVGGYGSVVADEDDVASLLTAILDAVEAGNDPIGEWISLYSVEVIATAAELLRANGCTDLADRLTTLVSDPSITADSVADDSAAAILAARIAEKLVAQGA